MDNKTTTTKLIEKTHKLVVNLVEVVNNINFNYKVALSNISSLSKKIDAMILRMDGLVLKSDEPTPKEKPANLKNMLSVEGVSAESSKTSRQKNSVVTKTQTKTTGFPGVRQDAVVNLEKQKRVVPSQTSEEKEDSVSFKEVGDTVASSDVIESTTKLQVEQKIEFDNGDSLSLASVKIIDANNKTKRVRTNHAGKWTNKLESGAYKINISKRATSLHAAIDESYTVIIPGDYLDSRFNLPPYIINK